MYQARLSFNNLIDDPFFKAIECHIKKKRYFMIDQQIARPFMQYS